MYVYIAYIDVRFVSSYMMYVYIIQIKDVRQETAGSVVFRRFHESCIPVTGFIRFRPKLGSFLRVFAGNSRKNASGIIDLGTCMYDYFIHLAC